MKNSNEELSALMQQEIDNEQKPEVRIKKLTPGLMRAIEIIKAYNEANNFDYEYSVDGLRWYKVLKKGSLPTIVELGMHIRRVKP